MGYAIHPQTSFCHSGDRLIIIDLRSNQYYCLPNRMRAAFANLCAGANLGAEDELTLRSLFDSGFLRKTEHPGLPEPCSVKVEELVAAIEGTVTVGDLASFTLSFVRANLQVKRKPLLSALSRLRITRSRQENLQSDCLAARAAEVSKRFSIAHSMQGKCLVHSLAVADWLVRRDARPRLVFGVIGRPFAAHCWVQLGNIVVNDRPEHVRMFTPVMVI